MEIKNNLPNEDIVDLIDSFQLLYKDNDNIGNSITDIGPMRTQQHVQNKASALKNTSTTQGRVIVLNIANTSQSDDIMNIQLLYNLN